jgi:hypothetical protein
MSERTVLYEIFIGADVARGTEHLTRSSIGLT